MDNDQRRELLWSVLGRFDSYVIATNSKAAMIGASSSFVIGSVFLRQHAPMSDEAMTGVVITLSFVFLSLIFAFLTVFPSFHNNTPESEREGEGSLIFFGAVAAIEPATEFAKQCKERSEDAVFLDLATQVHLMANIVKQKHQYLRIAYGSMFVGLVSFCVTLFLSISGT